MNADLGSNAKAVAGLPSASSAGGATRSGSGIDTTGFRWAYVILDCGAINSNGLTVKVQESSDNGSSDAFADVSGASFSVTNADDNTVLVGQVDCHKREKYLRIQGVNGATNASVYGVTVVLSAAKDTILSGGGVTAPTFDV